MVENPRVSDRDKIKVLLVDDSPVFLQAASSYLRRQPELEIVSTLTSAPEVLEKIEHLRPHIVLADLNMPGMSGLELIARLRESAPAVGTIALTLLSAAQHRQAALAAGADDFVSKSEMIHHLLPAIRRVVTKGAGKRPINEPD